MEGWVMCFLTTTTSSSSVRHPVFETWHLARSTRWSYLRALIYSRVYRNYVLFCFDTYSADYMSYGWKRWMCGQSKCAHYRMHFCFLVAIKNYILTSVFMGKFQTLTFPWINTNTLWQNMSFPGELPCTSVSKRDFVRQCEKSVRYYWVLI